MANEEQGRAVDSLLKSRATFKARVEQFKTNLRAGKGQADVTSDGTIARMNVGLERLAEAYEEFIRVVTHVREDQREFISLDEESSSETRAESGQAG